MSGQTISQSETRIEALKLQSSAYGVTIPLVFGVTRITGNLVDYLGFVAVPHTTTQGGKGGVKVQNTSYTYQADVLMGLCHGPLTEVPRIWRGKKLYSGGWLPTQILTASEAYTPPGSGAMAYTVSHAATYLSLVGVSYLYTDATGDGYGGPPVPMSMPLAQGSDYTVSSAGAVTVINEAMRGIALTIVYQWASGTRGQTAMDQLGLTFKLGTIGQAAWSALPAGRDVGYSGLALVAGQKYDLGTGAQVENHLFEVVAPMAYHLGTTVPDVDPALMLRAALTQLQGGAGFPAAQLDNWGAWSDYCVAAGLLVSPAIEQQVSAAEIIRTAAKLTNAGAVWSDGRLKMRPFADTAESGNGRTFTPNITPLYALDDDCYAPSGSEPPVRVKLKSPADRKNHWRVEFLNRANQYNVEIAEAKDQADIDANGLRSADVVQAHWICESTVAGRVAQNMLQRSLYVCAEYTLALPEHFALIEPADMLTLTDTPLLMSGVPVLVTAIEEADDGALRLTCEEYPAGTASAALYPRQAGSGYQADYNAAPGNVDAPMIFEAPAALTATGIEIYVAVRGAGSNWGGCQMWVSLDGSNYKLATTVYGGARYGTLSAAAGAGSASIAVQGLGAAQLISGSAADAAALNTLCYVGGSNPEYLAHEGATLTGAGAYTLGGLVHAAYGTPALAHASGSSFARVDERIARSGDIDPSFVGKTISLKFCSFNLWGAGQQGLADVSAYTYTITGAMAAISVPIGSKVYRQPADPATSQFVPGGAIWFDSDDDNAEYLRVNGAWVSTRDGTIAIAKSVADAAAANATAALAALTNIASDSILSPSEKPAVVQDYAVITSEQAGIDAQATAYGITTEKTAYDNAVSALTSYLAGLSGWNTVPGSDVAIVGTTFRSNFAAVYTTRQALLNQISATAKALANTAQGTADSAVIAAGNAQTSANTANAALANIASDSLLTPDEKPRVIMDRDVIVAEQASIDAQATNYAVTTEKTTYDTAVTALTTYLATLTSAVQWDNLSGNTTIVGATFRAKFADVYVSRQALLDKIAANAKARLGALATLSTVDTAQIAVGAATDVAPDQGGAGDVGNGPGAGATSANVVLRTASYTNSTAAAVTVQIESGLTDSGLSWNGSYPTGTTTATLEWSSASLSGSIVLCSKWPNSAVTSHTIAPGGTRMVSLPAGETLTAQLRMIVVHSAEALIGFTSSRVVLTVIKR